MKNTLEGINSRLGDIEECISNLENKIVKITQKRGEKKESLRDLWDNTTHTSICIYTVHRRRERGRKCI